MESLLQVFGILIAVAIGLLPTIIAVRKDHPHKVAIILTNILGGMLWGLGWLAALIWCFVEPAKTGAVFQRHVGAELEALHNLKEKGEITEEQYQVRKHTLLGE